MNRSRCRAALNATILAALLVASGTALARVAGAMDPPDPWETAARLHVAGDASIVTGSGTVIRSDAGSSIVLTCAHLFRRPGALTVDLFRPEMEYDPATKKAGRLTFLEAHPGSLVAIDPVADLALVQIEPGRTLAASPILPEGETLSVGDLMVSVGCSHGADATVWTTRVSEIGVASTAGGRFTRCTSEPRSGRSGGGLFTAGGYVAGVCDFGDGSTASGLYAAPEAIRELTQRAGIFARRAAPSPQCPPGVQCPQVAPQPPRADPGYSGPIRRAKPPADPAPARPTETPPAGPAWSGPAGGTIADAFAGLDGRLPDGTAWLAVPAGIAAIFWPRRDPRPALRLAA